MLSFRRSSAALLSSTALLLALAGCGDDDGASDSSVPDAFLPDEGVSGDAPRDAPGGDAPDSGSADAGTVDAGELSDAGDDSATMFPDSGLPDPAWVPLDVVADGECPPFEACGGDIVGVWDTSGGCFELDIESAISRCPGASVTERSGRGRGRVIFGADGTAHRVAESQVLAGVFIPALCTAVISCEAIETMLSGSASSASCVSAASGDCNCEATYDFAIDNTSIYTTEGNEIVAPGKRWAYCVEGDSLSYEDTSPSGMREPGTVELARQ